jgi:hypothetical protein
MNWALSIGILLVSMVPLHAQGQQPDAGKLKAEAQKVVSIISGDKAKTQNYCQIANVGEQMNQAVQAKDKKKFEELAAHQRSAYLATRLLKYRRAARALPAVRVR